MNLRVLAVYLIFGVLLYLIYYTCITRNVMKRMVGAIDKCPFSTGTKFEVVKIIGTNPNARGIFSSALYGTVNDKFEARYTSPLYRNIQNLKNKMPEFQTRVYCSQSIPDTIVNKLVNYGAEVYIMSPLPKGHEGALWRFLPASGNLPFLSVDADDITSDKDIVQIKKWLKSGKTFYIKRHASTMYIKMTAGRWGGLANCIPDIQERIEKYCDHAFGFDEAFLNKEIYPLTKDSYYETPYDPIEYANILAIILVVCYLLYVLLN